MRIFRLNHILAFLTVALLVQLSAPGHADVMIPPEQIAAKVKEHILATTPLEEKDAQLDVEVMKLPAAPIVLQGESAEFFLEDSRPIPLTFRTVVQLTVSTDAETRQIGVPVRLFIEKPVWVTKRLVRAKEPITLKDVMLQTKRLDHEAPYSLGAQENITAYTSRVNLAPGSIVDIRKVAATPLVYRNDDVRIVLAMNNGVNVNVYGKAMEEGSMGKRIRVVQRMTHNKTRSYNAEVIGKNMVMVKL